MVHEYLGSLEKLLPRIGNNNTLVYILEIAPPREPWIEEYWRPDTDCIVDKSIEAFISL